MNKIEQALSRATDTKALELGPGAVGKAADMFKRLFPGKKAVIVAQTPTWEAAGKEVYRILDEAGIRQEEPFIFTDEGMHAEWVYIEQLDALLSKTDAIAVAVGSGVVNDLTKLSSFHNSRRYMIVGTAASMDGYTAFGASITKDGNKQTFSCTAPLGAIFDSAVAAKAPYALSASGYADLMAKIPAGADWIFAHEVCGETLDDFAFSLVQDGLSEALSDPAGVRAGDEKKVRQLAAGLLLSGFAMQAFQSSRPASGAEHQFSHLWDMEHLTVNGNTNSHGVQVGIGTLASTAFYELLFETHVEDLDVDKCVAAWKTWEETEADIRRIFNNEEKFVTRGLAETKPKYVDKDGLRTQLETFKAKWPDLKPQLQERILPFDEVRERLRLVGAPYEPEHIGLTRERLRESFVKNQYMRARLSVVDMAVRCCWLDEWLDRLFGKGGRWEI
ncbi:MAG: sn-glycerol-1-phosphate dehydrogenase [Clostridia bacterium]|nr:sn-glycerol-1-phosphate dehydrogenase [Clostridia bacterium]